MPCTRLETPDALFVSLLENKIRKHPRPSWRPRIVVRAIQFHCPRIKPLAKSGPESISVLAEFSGAFTPPGGTAISVLQILLKAVRPIL
jgi:hypothetical protein